MGFCHRGPGSLGRKPVTDMLMLSIRLEPEGGMRFRLRVTV